MHGATAVVLGGSVAGLCSAGVLAPHFDRVVVLERDELPPGAEHRRGVPQSKHPHFVLNAGRRAIGTIFPGFEESLIEAGGMLLMPSMDAAYGEMDGWGPRKTSTMTMIYSSRILIERVLREKVRDLPTIEIREGVIASGLSTTGGGTPAGRVTGVEYRDAHGETRILEADLVVDALGRGPRSGTGSRPPAGRPSPRRPSTPRSPTPPAGTNSRMPRRGRRTGGGSTWS